MRVFFFFGGGGYHYLKHGDGKESQDEDGKRFSHGP